MADVLCRPEAEGGSGAPPAHPAGADPDQGAARGTEGCRPPDRPGSAAPAGHRCRPVRRAARSARPHARRRAAGQPAPSRRHAEPQGLDRPEGRAHRRSGAGQVPRDGRSQERQRRAVLALRRAAPLLRRIRLGGGQRRRSGHARPGYRLAGGERRGPDAVRAGDAGLGQWARARLPPHDCGRCQLPVHGHRRGGEQVRRRGHPAPLCADLAPRHAEGRGLLHPARGPDRRARRQGAARVELQRRAQGRRDQDLQADDGRLARHHRQVLGGCPHPRPQGGLRRQARRHQAGQQRVLPDRLSAGCGGDPGRGQEVGDQQPVCRRQADDADRGLPGKAQRQAVRPADRLGLVLFHHQAAVQAAALAEPDARQLRPRHPRHHRARQGRVLPAGQQELRVRWPR